MVIINPRIARNLNDRFRILRRRNVLFAGAVEGATVIVTPYIFPSRFHVEIESPNVGSTIGFAGSFGDFVVEINSKYVIDNHEVDGISYVTFVTPTACTIYMRTPTGSAVPCYERTRYYRCRRLGESIAYSFGTVGEQATISERIIYVDDVLTVNDFVELESGSSLQRVQSISRTEDPLRRVKVFTASIISVPWKELKEEEP